MIVSRYVLEIPLETDHVGVLNTLTNGLVRLQRDVWEVAKASPASLTEEIKEALKREGILVESQCEDKYRARWWIRKFLEGGRVFHFALAPTLDCNLRCIYCYEWKERRPGSMSPEVLHASIAWLEKRIGNAQGRYKAIALGLFGGEVLLEPEIALHVCGEVRRIADSNGMNVGISMITNGTLLNRNWIEEAISICNPVAFDIQVTLDGPKEVHDSRKAFPSGAGSFDAIINGITDLKGLPVRLGIRTNVDEGNYPYVVDLYKYLREIRDRLPEKIRAYLFPVYSTGLPSDHYCIPYNQYLERLYPLWEKCAALGWEVASPLRFGPCGQQSEHTAIVDPNGYIYTCAGWIGVPEMAIGNVREDKWKNNYFEHMTHNVWEECIESCEVFPYCMGGCRYRAYSELGDWKAKHCFKDAIRESVIAFNKFMWRKDLEINDTEEKVGVHD